MAIDKKRVEGGEMSRIFRGVHYDKHRDRWAARIRFKTKTYYKYAKTEQEALDWYENKSLELYGFDRVNEPHPNNPLKIT